MAQALLRHLLSDLFGEESPAQQRILERMLKNIYNISEQVLSSYSARSSVIVPEQKNDDEKSLQSGLLEENSETIECLVRSSLKIFLLLQSIHSSSSIIDFSFLGKFTSLISNVLNDPNRTLEDSQRKTISMIPLHLLSEYCNHFNDAKAIEQIFNYCMNNNSGQKESSHHPVDNTTSHMDFMKCLSRCCSEFKLCALELLKTVKAVFDSKKVSKIEDTETCGKILLFVASVLPYNHDACINKGGHVNMEHHALLEQQVREEQTDATSVVLDDFETFWNLQMHIIQLVSLKTSLSVHYSQARGQDSTIPTWPIFSKEVDRMLKCIESRCISNIQTLKQLKRNKEKLQSDGKTSAIDTSQQQFEVLFSPIKLLKNRKLFDLQLDDIRFRRQVLIQLLIAISRLQEKNLDSHSYSAELKSMREKILAIMKKYDSDISAIMDTIFEREKSWTTWKANQCPAFFHDRSSSLPSSSKASLVFKNAAMLGFLESDTSSESVDTYLKSSENELRSHDFENYVIPIVKEEFDVTPSEKFVNSSNVFVWKSCRLLLDFDLKKIQLALQHPSISSEATHREEDHEGDTSHDHFLEIIAKQVLEQSCDDKSKTPLASEEHADLNNKEEDKNSKKRKLQVMQDEDEHSSSKQVKL
ncbi:hypothetical protein FDP41_001208 [Naegleria fowleri]|uniref:Uncharacterized protein n=1 Tax=Naegleria fowleri TaxID=5763 RepID=A0A6A5C3I8_NAEFO|nr:uncharacterized protein FDP41_001208 [Naegleria fowleri]KAF0980055.1 hypothetical protein FDP41_001208 [Naegleria fowleri]CAG4715656.1 unnamed protein product [Naegleria fowleri]